MAASRRTVRTPAPGPKIRTAEKTNVSEMEISALTLGSLTVAVPLMSVRAARTSHSDSGKVQGYSAARVRTASAASAMTHHT